jgi:hypothetical protein
MRNEGKRTLKNGRKDGSFGTMYVVSVGSGSMLGSALSETVQWRATATVPANRNPELRCDIQLFGTTVFKLVSVFGFDDPHSLKWVSRPLHYSLFMLPSPE